MNRLSTILLADSCIPVLTIRALALIIFQLFDERTSDLFWFKKVESQYTLCILFTPRSYLSSFKKDEHELISLDAFFIVVLHDMTFFFFLEQQQGSWKKRHNIFKISYIFKLFLKSNRAKEVPKLPNFWAHGRGESLLLLWQISIKT